MFTLRVFLLEVGWEALVFGHFSQPATLDCLLFLLYQPRFLILRPRVGSTFPRLILVPSVHIQSGWGWLSKLESMTLSGAKYWMAVRAAFPSRYTFQRTLLYWPRYFRFFPSCSYTLFALPSSETSDMPRTESSSTVSQGYFVLVLPSLGYNVPRLGPLGPNE